MTADQFWDGDPELVVAYRRAAELENQRTSEREWLQGLYFYQALCVALHNSLSKKGTKPIKYLQEPIRIIPLTEEEKKEKAEIERQRVIDYFNNLQKRFKRKGE